MSAADNIIQVDPEVLGGTPVFRGTRVPVNNLRDYLAAGDALDQFARSPLPSSFSLHQPNRLEALTPLIPALLETLKTLSPRQLGHVRV